MCANVPMQDLSTHDINQLWRRDFLLTYTTKELLEGRSPLSVKQLAALYALNRDYMAITQEDRYQLFKACNDGLFHSTVLKMSKMYFDAIAPTYVEHAKESSYLSSIRIVTEKNFKETHNDNSLLVLQFEAPLNSINDGMYSDNPNLLTVILPHTLVYVGNNAFANCTNLRDVYVNGNTTFEDSALPSSATVHIVGDGAKSSGEEEALKKEIDLLNRALEEAKSRSNGEEVKALEEKLAASEESKASYVAECEELKERLEKLDEKCKAACEVAGDLNSDFRKDSKKHEAEIEDLKKQLSETTKKYEETRETLEKVTECDRRKAQDLEDEMYNISKSLQEAEERIKEKDATIADYEKEIEETINTIEKLNNQLPLLQEKMDKTSEEIKKKDAIISDMSIRIKNLQDMSGNASGPLNEFKDKYEYASKELTELRAEMSKLQDDLIDATDILKRFPLLSMLPNCDDIVDEENIEYIESIYDTLCVLRYKYDIEKLSDGEIPKQVLERCSTSPKATGEVAYVQAFNMLKELNDNGQLHGRHADAINELIANIRTSSDYKNKILQIITSHGYTESDYDELYNECLHSLNSTLVKYTPEADRDKLIADSMNDFLNNRKSEPVVNGQLPIIEEIEARIREKKGLGPTDDVGPYMTKLENMCAVLSETANYETKEEAMLVYVDRFF